MAAKLEKGEPRGQSSQYVLTPEALHRLERAAKGPREKAYIRLMARWGLRASEIAHFCPEWVSGQRGTLTIPMLCGCPVCAARPAAKRWRCKTEAGNRSLPISKHTESWEAVKLFLVRHGAAEDTQISRQAVWKLVKRVADHAGLLELVFPHALRATAATQLVDMGFTAHQVCRAMGWSSLQSAEPYIRRSSITVDRALDGKDLQWW